MIAVVVVAMVLVTFGAGMVAGYLAGTVQGDES